MIRELKRVSIVFYMVVESGSTAPTESEQVRRCVRDNARDITNGATVKPAEAQQLCEDGLDDIEAFGGDEALPAREWLQQLHNAHICKGCRNPIDPDTCGCGASKRSAHESHMFVPMGCNCFRVKPNPERRQTPKIGAKVRLIKEKHYSSGVLRVGTDGEVFNVEEKGVVWAKFPVPWAAGDGWHTTIDPDDVVVLEDPADEAPDFSVDAMELNKESAKR